MLTDPSADIQVALSALLLESDQIAALVGDRVYDRIPNVPVFPYVTIGEVQMLPELSEGTDAAESFVVIHTWERFKTFKAVKRLGKAIINLLHDSDLTISEGVVQSMLLQSSNYVRDPDGLTSHGILTFHILTDANAT